MSKNKKYFRRLRNIRKENKIIYIFTEGEKTEPNYFKSIKKEIRKVNIKIKIKGKGFNTLSLVNHALGFIENKVIDLNIDDCWVVFDKDDFDVDFNIAIDKAEKNNLKVEYSNESFELWYLLHFNYNTAELTRDDYTKKLEKELQKLTGNIKYKYYKNSNEIYSLIKDKEKTAIKNAKKLVELHKNKTSYVKKNPSTTVYLLLESLNSLKK